MEKKGTLGGEGDTKKSKISLKISEKVLTKYTNQLST